MRQLLTPRQAAIVDMARSLAETFAPRAAEYDRSASFPKENYEDLRAAGYLGLTVPEELGGMGASLYEFLLAQETLATGDAATALAVNMHLNPMGYWGSIWRLNGSPALEAILRRAGEGDLIWAGFTSERGLENAIMDAISTATRVDGGYRVSGYKIFCTNIEVATEFSLTARCDDSPDGPELLVLATKAGEPGLQYIPNWDVLGMRSTQSGDLEVSELFVPDSQVLHRQPVGHFNEVIARTSLGWGVASFGAVYCGIAAAALDWAKQMLLSRGREEDPVMCQHVGEMETLLETARAVLFRHADEVDSGRMYESGSVQEMVARSTLAKTVPVASGRQIFERVIDLVGGVTFSRRVPFERMLRDSQAGPLMPPNNILARRLLGATSLGVELAPDSTAGVTWKDNGAKASAESDVRAAPR